MDDDSDFQQSNFYLGIMLSQAATAVSPDEYHFLGTSW